MSDTQAMMKPLQILSRRNRPSTLAVPSSLRVEVCPPSLRQAPDSAWQRAMFWLLAPAPQDASPPPSRLLGVRGEFTALLSDIDDAAGRQLCERIARAPSLRDLWHLRAEAYRVIGLAHSQCVAETRLARLNRHFPTRAPRSSWATS